MKFNLIFKIKIIVLLQIFLWVGAESVLPQSNAETAEKNESLYVPVESVLPALFIGAQPDVIQDPTGSLSSFFEKLLSLKNCNATENATVRIVHIGDSHVRSHEFTPAFNFRLTETFGNAAAGFIEGYRSEGILTESGSSGIICHCIGINGATSENFMNEKYLAEIQRLRPDLIIISLGTNESFGKYDVSEHYALMDNLYSLIKSYCPEVPLLYTTPPGAFKTIYGRYRRKKRIYRKVIRVEENRNIEKSASTIVSFAENHRVACWDLFNIVGGESYACKNWLDGNYFQRDRVHFVRDGYVLQGNMLYEALIASYNTYVSNKE